MRFCLLSALVYNFARSDPDLGPTLSPQQFDEYGLEWPNLIDLPRVIGRLEFVTPLSSPVQSLASIQSSLSTELNEDDEIDILLTRQKPEFIKVAGYVQDELTPSISALQDDKDASHYVKEIPLGMFPSHETRSR